MSGRKEKAKRRSGESLNISARRDRRHFERRVREVIDARSEYRHHARHSTRTILAVCALALVIAAVIAALVG